MVILLTLGLLGLALAAPGPRSTATEARVIVQGHDAGQLERLVHDLGGRVTHELPIIDAVGATVPRHRIDELAAQPAVTRLFEDRAVEACKGGGGGGKGGGGGGPSSAPVNPTYYPSLVGADRLHAEGVTGNGVTVAVLDSGFWAHDDISRTADRKWRQLDHYDAIRDRVHAAGDPKGKNTDSYGHAAHVLSVLLSSGESQSGVYHGVAPNVDVLPVKVLGRDGSGSYADVIRGIGFVVANKDHYGVRVMNLSLSAPAQSRYWDDPLNQAVMRAWQAGIVVVASAGNTGPDAQTIGVPGNVPYVITVGAMTDNYTPGDPSDDFLATFSSTGPTREGFLKPEVLAPGGHMLGLMHPHNEIAEKHSEYHDGGDRFVMSGTSQSAAVVSGIAALILEQSPWLTPDQVKARLMETARPAVDSAGAPVYTVFQQGAGLVDAYAAANSQSEASANAGLHVGLDLAGAQHFGGLANQLPDGTYYLMGLGGHTWSGGFMWSDGMTWSDTYTWSDGLLWSDGMVWSDGYMWSDGLVWSDGMVWSDSLPMAANVWVDQQ